MIELTRSVLTFDFGAINSLATGVSGAQYETLITNNDTKGRMAVVEGRLQIRDWTDRDGGKRRSAEVIADNVYFGDSKRDSGGDYGSAPAYSAPYSGYAAPAAPAGGHSDFAEIGEEDGELPF